MSMAVLQWSMALRALSIVKEEVIITETFPIVCLSLFFWFIHCQATSICSRCHSIAILMPSEGSVRSRISKDTFGLGKFD